jgi:outer membrane autotransporter protein
MKPKYRNLARILPAAVTIALSLPSATQAAIFADDTAGNAQPTSADNGANTIRANGGTSANPFINIIAGVSMTGSIAPLETEVVEITAANYTVTNAGSLAGSAHDGINSTFAFTLTNSGIISAAGGNQGVQTVGLGTSITNSGTISGTDDAILFSGNGGTVINSGLIDGITGPASDGIFGNNGVTVTNNAGGTIRGLDNGIDMFDTLNLTNNYNATITGINNSAVFANDSATINNYGSISGGTSGISVTSGAIINNNTTFLIGPDAGGQITGLNGNGITATTGLMLTNEALGLIQGSISGVQAGNSATITNQANATITGTTDAGLRLGDLASVTNSGTITGLEYGVNLSTTTTASVTNNAGGIITGTNQFGVLGDTGVETVTNAGTITGGLSALQLNGGANIVNLNDGSVLNGDARASGGGSLDITMNGGLISTGDSTQNTINGGVFNAVTLNKTGSGMAVVTGTTAADAISVTGGYLYLGNNVTNAAGGENTISASGAEIGGLGTWDSSISLINGASISPGSTALALTNTVANSIGTLTVAGDVTLSSSSAYVWNVTPGGASDRINLTGAGNVFTTNNSDFVISPTDVNTPLLDGSTTVVATDSLLVGGFGSITVDPLALDFNTTTPDYGPFEANFINPIIVGFSSLDPSIDNTDWVLTIEHDYSQFGSTENEVAAGKMLNGLVDTATGNVADLLAAMDYSDEFFTQAVLAALDPGAYMATAAGLASNNYHLHRTVENHNAAVRAGSIAPVMAPPAEPSAKGATVAAPMAIGCAGSSNVWGSFSYDWQDLQTSSSSFDQDGEVYAFTAGIDFTLAENFRLGIVAEGSQSDWDGDLDLGSEVESYRFAAYANWGAATGWFVDALLGYNTHSVDQSRGSIFGNESADYDADGWQGLINVGYAIETSAGSFSPYLGLEWQSLSADSFDTEDGPLAISYGDYDIDTFRVLAGVRWEAELTENVWGYASATYAFEVEDDAADTTVDFGGSSYRASGLEQGDSVLVSAGIRWGVATCTTIDFGYRGEFAMDDGIDSNGANIGLNYSF